MTTLSSRQLQLLNWFRRSAPSLATAYEGALRLLNEPEFPGRVHFIAHAVRDIANRLPYALDPQLPSKRVEYANHLGPISKSWIPLDSIATVATHSSQNHTISIDYKLARKIDALVRSHNDSQRRPSNEELLFRFLMRNDGDGATVNQRLVRDFKGVREWFMENTHFPRTVKPNVDEIQLRTRFYAFEAMLHSFVGDFFTGTAELDDALQQANERAD